MIVGRHGLVMVTMLVALAQSARAFPTATPAVQATPMPTAPATWPQIFDKVRRYGDFYAPGDMSWFRLESLNPFSPSEQIADVIEVWGHGDDPARFEATSATLEEWVMDDDQDGGAAETSGWSFILDTEGRIERVERARRSLPADDPRVVAELASLRDFWDAYSNPAVKFCYDWPGSSIHCEER